MLKHIYKIIVLTFAFFIAIFVFGQNIREEEVSFNSTVEMGETSYPVMYIGSGENIINPLHGYSGSIDANVIRESITPVDSAGTVSVQIDENGSNVKKLKYELRDSNSNSLIEANEINALKRTETGKSAKIKFDAVLNSGKEYALRITTVTGTSKKIHFYTRVKLIEDGHLKEKIDFAMDFHNAVLDKKKAENIVKYLEPTYSAEDNSLAHVTINSSFNQISFGGLKPKVISKIVPVIKESNIETATIELSYMASSKTDSGQELYNVKEYFRVRYTTDRMYLLHYERFMESVFDVNLTSLAKSEFKIGITNDKSIDLVTNSSTSKVCFVRERELWYYDLKQNRAVKVFSFRQENTDYIRDNYDQHNVKILSMDEEGTIDFIVYGYMNRGDYEGRVAIVLYKFYSEDNRIEEQVYIPVEIPYQVLKENLNQFSYVNRERVFYFSINQVVYAYNMITNHLEKVVSEVTSDSFLMSKEGKFIAWQNSSELKNSTQIVILDLETGAKKAISAGKGQNIRLFGSIGENLIYGTGKTSDISELSDGRIILPAENAKIADKRGNVLKNYKRKNIYITNAQVNEGIVELERVKKSSSAASGYKKVKIDFLLNNIVEQDKPIYLSERVTEKTLVEYYISMPLGFTMSSKPLIENTISTIITENSTLHLKEDAISEERFYSYALGGIVGSFDNPADAIVLADEKMGTVLNGKYQMVWERGGKFTRSSIEEIEKINSGSGNSSVNACIRMLLAYNKIYVDQSEISSRDSIYTSLRKNMKTEVLNLTGCNLDEVLYYVSKKRPVIAMKDENSAVIIIGYDEFNVTYLDPATGYLMKKGLNDGGEMFYKAGNIFFSYMEY